MPAFPKLSETFVVSKFLGLLNRGWDVHVVCQESSSSVWRHFPDLANRPDSRARVHVGWPHRPRWWALALMPFALLCCLLRNPTGTFRYGVEGVKRFGLGVVRLLYLDATVVSLHPDLVHFEFGALAVGKMYLKGLLGCKVTTSFRGYDLNLVGLDTPDHFREVWKNVDAVHLLGENLWRRAQERGCPPEKAHTLIPPAVDTDYFRSGDLEKACAITTRPLRIVSVGRLTWEKGYDYAIEAVAVLARQGVQVELRILGEGNLFESLAFARHQMEVVEAVQLLGAVPKSAVRNEMLDADVFLHAAVSEGFGNAVIEAQAMSLPVVCTDAGGLPENVIDGETGFVVPRRDAKALAAKLAVLAQDPTLRQRIGEAGRRRVSARFQLADQIVSFGQFYREVIHESSASLAPVPGDATGLASSSRPDDWACRECD